MHLLALFYPLSAKIPGSFQRIFCVIFVKNRLMFCESSVFVPFNLFYFCMCIIDAFLSSIENPAFMSFVFFWLKNCIYIC